MAPLRNQRRIFVVDDEQVIASTLAKILTLQGFNATSFRNPLEALDAARSDAPDLLISDVVMPVLSGVDLAIQVQERCPECKVLLFSGQSSAANRLNAARADGHDFELLLKPVHPKDLLMKIEEVTEGAMAALPAGGK